MNIQLETMKLIKSSCSDYELIDSGNFEKLERFGKYIIWRPEPQAIWNKSLSGDEWEKLYNAKFQRKKAVNKDLDDPGEWILKNNMPEQWVINYKYGELEMRFRLGLTSFKHVGVFPEQSENWNFIYNNTRNLKNSNKKILNLFAYTGGASLAAKAAGGDVFHVDSVKQVISWAKQNMENSGLKDIRWVVEDTMKFVKREVRRGSKYSGIILDPPAYGRGPEGEKWILENNLNELISLCSELLEPENSFLLLNLYSVGFSALVADNLINSYFNKFIEKEIGELFIEDKFSKRLPLGVFVRFIR
jgi:23S rRNA (cytosine1962-C5)-methyltransferase